MILTIAALLPTIVLMVYIYKLDQVEKEPVGLLIKTFLFGALTIIPVYIVEVILSNLLGLFLPVGSSIYIIAEDYIAIAMTEEFFKRFAAKKAAYNNPEFNYLFDGIVYSVFASLGFAAIENIMYVLENGLGVAFLRAVTSIPGHAIFGVFMGYYLGKAKMARLHDNKHAERTNLRKSLLIPVFIHGFYDATIELNYPVMMLIWFVFLIIMEVRTYRFVKKQAKNDHPLY